MNRPVLFIEIAQLKIKALLCAVPSIGDLSLKIVYFNDRQDESIWCLRLAMLYPALKVEFYSGFLYYRYFFIRT